MSKNALIIISAVVGCLQAIGVALVTCAQPDYAASINSAIVIAGTVIVGISNLFTDSSNE